MTYCFSTQFSLLRHRRQLVVYRVLTQQIVFSSFHLQVFTLTGWLVQQSVSTIMTIPTEKVHLSKV